MVNIPWIGQPPPKVSNTSSNISVGIWPIDPSPGMQVNNQVLANEPDISNMGAKKLKTTASDRERSNFDDMIATSPARWLKELCFARLSALVYHKLASWGSFKSVRNLKISLNF
jgi:hypothetical protein